MLGTFSLRLPKELQKTQIEEDEKALRVENQSLREQLANEQRALDQKKIEKWTLGRTVEHLENLGNLIKWYKMVFSFWTFF